MSDLGYARLLMVVSYYDVHIIPTYKLESTNTISLIVFVFLGLKVVFPLFSCIHCLTLKSSKWSDDPKPKHIATCNVMGPFSHNACRMLQVLVNPSLV